MKLFCFGLNHRTAPIETRERFAGHTGSARQLRRAGVSELMLLVTCNRVEIYGVSEKLIASDEIARCLLTGESSVTPLELEGFYRHGDEECTRHLFRVASGMDSMVVGETEILGQAKRAYERAQAGGDTGPLLHRVCQRAFRVAKLVRTRTEITRGSVSVGSVAVDLAEKIFGDLRKRRVLVLGAGEASEKTVRALAGRGVSDLRVSNRSPARAEELAAAVNGMAVPFANWLEQCREIDILISSITSDGYLLDPSLLTPLLSQRRDRPLFLIDIAVPRNIAPTVNGIDGVYLYDIDALQSIADEAVDLRRQQFVLAEEIIEEHLRDLYRQIGPKCESVPAERAALPVQPIAPALGTSQS